MKHGAETAADVDVLGVQSERDSSRLREVTVAICPPFATDTHTTRTPLLPCQSLITDALRGGEVVSAAGG